MDVGIIMGSDSDWGVMKSAVDTLKSFGVDVKVIVASAHRTPQKKRKKRRYPWMVKRPKSAHAKPQPPNPKNKRNKRNISS